MGEADSLATLVESIAGEFAVVAGRPAKVRAGCVLLRERLARPPAAGEREALGRLAPLLRTHVGEIAQPLFELLEETAAASDDPWPLLAPLLLSRDPGLARRALATAERLVGTGSLAVDRRLLLFFAEQATVGGPVLGEPETLATIARILRRRSSADADPALALYRAAPDFPVRLLAARLLDLDGQPAPADRAADLLGADAHAFLDPYLRFTGASHEDLLSIRPEPGRPPPALASLRRAQESCGEALLRRVIAELGWGRVNLGLEARLRVGVSLAGSVPLFVAPAETPLLECFEEARRTHETWVFVAHGGRASGGGEPGDGGVVDRFRAYNLAHAQALADILDVAPLTGEKVLRVLATMDRIVAEFTAIFAAHAEECAQLPALYGDLRARVVRELEREGAPAQLSAELTRLVQSFEDPRNLGEVRTLHGLKRYLHQRGLRLGFRLVGAGGATNRTVDLVLAAGERALRSVRKIAYVDFEPEAGPGVPYAVAVVADGFARQALHGQESFPGVQVFCYGNEVHYYLSFRNHPALLRVDYSPPLLGGMIDLEYYGVSVYELSTHPNPSLEALRLFFERLEFYVALEGTRVHARYDKERALDLGEVCEKAELLCALVPYLMDLDWTIGALDLDGPARRQVAEAWAESFAEWGVLPLRALLTRDRKGILVGIEKGPGGTREVAWTGQAPYRDLLRVPPPRGLARRLRASLRLLGLEAAPLVEAEAVRLIGQDRLERRVLRPLRESGGAGLERRHAACVFAELLQGGRIGDAAALARLVTPLERTLRFRAGGLVNGHELQSARLPLRGEALGLHVLRDGDGAIRLAFYTRGGARGTSSTDPAELAALLRRNNYVTAGASPEAAPAGEAEDLLAWFRRPRAASGPRPLPGECVLEGLRASPGRAVGRALFGTAGRRPEDFDTSILVAPAVRPEDGPFLYHARGIVSTGGGILSHAGLIATQLHKPALVASGTWRREPDGSTTLLYLTPEYHEEAREAAGLPVVIFRDWREREHGLREGDLVVLDAGAATLRVLGQGGDALALDQELRRLGEAQRRLESASAATEVLALRGRRVRAVHQLRGLLERLDDPVLARHAAHELLAGELLAAGDVGHDDRAALLAVLLANAAVGDAARRYLVLLAGEVAGRHATVAREARRQIPSAGSTHEILARRRDALQLGQAVEDIAAALRACGVEPPASAPTDAGLDRLAVDRLVQLRDRRLAELAAAPGRDPRRRHLLRQLERLALLLAEPETDEVRRARLRLAGEDERARRALAGRRVLDDEEAGFELHPLIGWKAANLAEVARLGVGRVPPWFVVTDCAFQEVLDAPVAEGALRGAIAAVLARGDLDYARQSAAIRRLWDAVELPGALERDVRTAYRRLAQRPGPGDAPDDPAGPFLAIRSSAREEDAELAARAGEFDTFLFVRGEQPLLAQLRRAWSGLWTERALHNRALAGTGQLAAGGGVVVQRIVWSRVAGVLQTVNVAEGAPGEMVVNVGLGLGEGVVSGTVAADHVVVAKDGDLERGPLRFRYVTADKRERIVFDRRAGFGTSRVECLYHQRLRPALEYVELAELVRVAALLEAAYGYPLDVEFGIEGAQLFVLQARPVASFLSLLQTTLERHPLERAAAAARIASGGARP
jgi:pyruvate,water dikinase